MTMRTAGASPPDFELPDDRGVPWTLSAIQGDDPLVLMIGRGEHCPRERQHQRELIKLHEWSAFAFTQMATILPNSLHDTAKLRISTGAFWPFLADAELEMQRTLGIREYTDPHHDANVPHTLVLAPGLVIDEVYVGYWFWAARRPTSSGRTCKTSCGGSSRTSTRSARRRRRRGRRGRLARSLCESIVTRPLSRPARRLRRPRDDGQSPAQCLRLGQCS
jgi:peroxiredoxin